MFEWTNGAPVLPVQLSEGATATPDGILFQRGDRYTGMSALVESYATSRRMVPWHAAAERLRYREGEPWCARYSPSAGTYNGTCSLIPEDGPALHRIAAILCDDAEAFRVLHWCVHNLGGNHATQ